MKKKNIITGSRLKYCREYNNKTLEEIGNYLGVHKSTISRWEKGETDKISLATISLLAKYYGVSESWLSGKDVPIEKSKEEEQANLSNIKNIEPMPTMVKVPLLGTIACGEPILAEENIEDYINMPEKTKGTFALRCKGDSMINARIFDGDIVYIREQPDVENGEIAAVLIENEATLKRVYKTKNSIELRPENPTFKPLYYQKEEMNKVRILGKAVGFYSNVV